MSSKKRAFFAVQICVPYNDEKGARLRRLSDYLRHHKGDQQSLDMARNILMFADAMLALLPVARKGIWDFWGDNHDRSVELFSEWEESLDASDVRKTAVPMASYRGANTPRFGLVTMALLLAQDSSARATLAAACDNPFNGDLFSRAAFRSVIDAVRAVSPVCIASTVLFVVPGQADFALTEADMDTDDYKYLRPIT